MQSKITSAIARIFIPLKNRTQSNRITVQIRQGNLSEAALGWRGSEVFKRNETSVFRQGVFRILPHSSGRVTTMRTMFVILALALIAITFEIYSDASLTSAEFSHASVPDPASAAIAHGPKHG
jgi:hypothetical protein